MAYRSNSILDLWPYILIAIAVVGTACRLWFASP